MKKQTAGFVFLFLVLCCSGAVCLVRRFAKAGARTKHGCLERQPLEKGGKQSIKDEASKMKTKIDRDEVEGQ